MSLRLKTMLGVAIIEAVLLAILLSLVIRYMTSASEESLVNYAHNMSSLFAATNKDAVISYDLASIESFISEILKNEGVLYARVLDGDGGLLGFGKKNHHEEKPFVEDSSLESVDDEIYDTRADISEGGALYGTVQMGVSTSRILEQIAQVKRMGAAVALFEMGLVGLFSFVLGVYLTKQLVQLRKAARSVASGDLGVQVPIRGDDEVTDLARSFNKMIASLKKSDAENEKYRVELEDLNRDLEARVLRRTQQLMDKNAELEQAYDSLKEAQAALLQSEKMASLGQMAAGVAHEINNPMSFVKSSMNAIGEYVSVYNQLLKEQDLLIEMSPSALSDDQNHQLQKINQLKDEEDIGFIQDDIGQVIKESISGIHRVTEIVESLKSFSRIDQVELHEADINTCLDETLAIASSQLKYKCRVHKNYEALPSLTCNPGKLNQVFLNLIMNACDAIEEKGDIFVKTWMEEKSICVSIKDTGAGIKPEDLEKLFDPFFTTKPVGKGTGLGLSISHGIVNEHQGEIGVYSELGKGTEFVIRLPL